MAASVLELPTSERTSSHTRTDPLDRPRLQTRSSVTGDGHQRADRGPVLKLLSTVVGVTLFLQPAPTTPPALPSPTEQEAAPTSAPTTQAPASAHAAPEQEALDWIKATTGLSWARIANLLGVTRQTIHDWRRGIAPFDRHAQRLYTVRELLERAADRHTDARRLRAWLDTPRGADGRTPAQFIESQQFDRARLLALSTPLPGVARFPAWLDRQPVDPDLVRTDWRREPARPEPDDEPTFDLG